MGIPAIKVNETGYRPNVRGSVDEKQRGCGNGDGSGLLEFQMTRHLMKMRTHDSTSR